MVTVMEVNSFKMMNTDINLLNLLVNKTVGAHISKKLGQGHVYHCVTSLFLLMTMRSSYSSSFESTILPILVLNMSFLSYFIFRSGLQAGQTSTRTLLLRSNAVVTHAECGSALSC